MIEWCFDTKRIVEFVQDNIGHRPDFGPCAAIGVQENGILFCGVVYNEYREPEGDVRMHIAATNPKWCLPGRIRAFFDYPFNQLGCQRVTAVVSEHNGAARKLDEYLGFVHEGTIRRGFPDGSDAILYGMLKEECRWFQPKKRA